VKKKQKKIMMIALGVVAAALCALKLGPILSGAPLRSPGAKKKSGGSKPKRSRRRPTRRSTRKKAASRQMDTEDTSLEEAQSEWSLETVPVDLSAASHRPVLYEGSSLRNPFGPASFELAQQRNVLSRVTLRLQGVVRAGGKRSDGSSSRLAIIDDRVYREGDEVAPGVRLIQVDAASVLLADGKNQVRLTLSGPRLKLRKR